MPVPDTFLTFNLKGEMALADGNRTLAIQYFLQSLEWEPWQPHVIYRIWDCLRTRSSATPKDYRIIIAFYTFNKFEMTLKTLESLLASRTYGSPIYLLNNGSTEFRHEDFARAVKEKAQGYPVHVLYVPVNIGAPAARNWLWHLPEVEQADLVAFLDDDVLVPTDWLDHYVEDLADFPDAVVVGPRGLNPGTLPTIQYLHRYFSEYGHHYVRFTPAAPLFMDLGQYTYRHPCLSVMGCCHLFHRRRWRDYGIPDFDIRFSPSQVDDIEHDLQIWLNGGQVIYDGRVAVVHCQDAGRKGVSNRSNWGHVWGNHLKLEAKFTHSQLETIDRRLLDAEKAFEQRILDDIRRAGILLPQDLPISFIQ